MSSDKHNLRSHDAHRAINSAVDVFIVRCAAALDGLKNDDYESFEQAFRLQQISWANLDALIAKGRREIIDGEPLVDDEMVRTWITRCQTASVELSQKINSVIEKTRTSSTKAGSMRRALSSFKSLSTASWQEQKFFKRA